MKCSKCGGFGSVGDSAEECEACGGDGLATARDRADAMIEAFKDELVAFNAEALNDKVDKLAAACALAGAEGVITGLAANAISQLEALKKCA